MKKLLIILGFAFVSSALFSCGEICVRCENGSIPDVETKCFTDKGERNEYVLTRELQGYSCNDN